MAHPRILHMITPLKHMSPFDVNMALDAGYDAAIPYTSVTVEDVTGLGQSSWGPTGFAFAESEAEGQALLIAARAHASSARLRFELARGRNQPASIEAR